MSTAIARPSKLGISAVGWQAAGDLSFGEWADYGRKLAAIGRAAPFWIGDWLNYGEAAYGEKYSAAVEITGYDVGSLMDMAWVAGRFEFSRRRESLSWSHHREVAALDPDRADALLERAEAESWSRARLRTELRGLREDERTPADAADPSPPSRAEIVIRSRRGPEWLAACLAVLDAHAHEFGLEIVRSDLS